MNTMKIKDFIIDFQISWNTTHMMLERFVPFCAIIINIIQVPSNDIALNMKQYKMLKQLSFTRIDWNLLISSKNVLKSFYEATQILSGQRFNTIGMFYILVKSFKRYLSNSNDNEEKFESLKTEYFEYYFGDTFITKEQRDASMVKISKYFFIVYE